MKKFNSIIALMMAGLVGLSTASCSDDDLNTNPYSKGGVNLLAYGPSPILRTNEIRITGTNLQNVQQVLFVGADPVTRDQFNKSDNQNIYVNVPDASLPGQIALVAGKDTIKSITPLTFEEAIEISSITPTTNLNAGDVVTITGEYVWNVATITFTSGVTVEAADFISANRKEIKVAVPKAAESGTITFSDGADWEFESKESLQINGVKINSVTESSDFGQTINITGVNLHTVEKVLFAGGVEAAFKVANNGSAIEATVPADAKSGAITLQAFSGAMTTSETAVNLPEVAIESVSKDKDIIAGDEIVVTGKNFDRIKDVFLGDAKVEGYKIEGNTLTLTVPEGTGDCDLKLVQNANIAPTHAIVARKLAGIIWMGNIECTSAWSGALDVINNADLKNKFKEAMTGAGVITIGVEVPGDDAQMKIAGSDWNSPVFSNVPADCIVRPTKGQEEVSFDVTNEDIEKALKSGFVIYGCNYKIKYVKYVVAGAPVEVWSGSFDGDWVNWELGKGTQGDGNPSMFVDAGLAESNIIRVHATPKDPGAKWEFQMFDGKWGGLDLGYGNGNNINSDFYNLDEHNGCIEVYATSTIADGLTLPFFLEWGMCGVIQSNNLTITKITVAPM